MCDGKVPIDNKYYPNQDRRLYVMARMQIGDTVANMCANGTAVVVGYVTSAAIRPESRFAAGGNK
jgi:hypothetical protein